MRYDSDLLYRPPGEWRSYLLQCTIGCSHNKCTFCAMYKEKKFRVRPVEEILEDIDMARSYYGPNVERVFLMDGDAIVMRTEQLLQILKKLYAAFPKLQKVTTYAGPRSTPEQDAGGTARPAGGRTDPGLSGGGERQRRSAPGHPKGCTAAEMLQAGQNLVAAGIDLWAIVILGLTGQGGDWEEHVLSTAGIINKMKPRHLSAMTFCPCGGHPAGGGRAGRALSGVPGPDPGGVPPSAGAPGCGPPPLHQQPRLQLPAPEGGGCRRTGRSSSP